MLKLKDRLTDAFISSAEPRETQYKLFDGAGLFLLVSQSGGKWWRFKYRLGGRENLISFGIYPSVSLQHARHLRDEARQMIEKGIDPSAARKAEKADRTKNDPADMPSVRFLMDGSVELWKGRKALYLLPDEARFFAEQLSALGRCSNGID
jgi:hypothetical protein